MSFSEQTIRPYLQMLITENQLEVVFSKINIPFLNSEISVENLGAYGFLEYLFRKGAHLFFYSILGYVISRYFMSSLGYKKGRIFVFSMFTLLIISMLDEYLQYLQMERSGQWADVWLNCIGGVKGVLTGLVAGYNQKRRRQSIEKAQTRL